MNYDIELSPKAAQELYEAWEWYEEEKPTLGDRFQREVLRKINFIHRNPLHYPLKKLSRNKNGCVSISCSLQNCGKQKHD